VAASSGPTSTAAPAELDLEDAVIVAELARLRHRTGEVAP
jgi:hypothetical protein